MNQSKTFNLNKLDIFSTYKDGWNGYNSKAIDVEYVNYVKALVDYLSDDLQPEIMLQPTGLIQFEWECDCYYLEITVRGNNDFRIFNIIKSEELEFNVNADVYAFKEIIEIFIHQLKNKREVLS